MLWEKPDCVTFSITFLKTKIILITENLAQAAAAAKEYFKRICRWDDVEPSEVKLFGFDLAPIEEVVSQIAFFYTQDVNGAAVEGPLLYTSNAFNLMEESQYF